MRLQDFELISKKYAKFTQSFTNNTGTVKDTRDHSDDSIGGIIQNGKLGWLAKGPYFEIFTLRSGQKIASFRFDNCLSFEKAIITTICEIEVKDLNCCLLAIGLQFGDAPGGVIAIYSVQGSKILRCIDIGHKVTSCHSICNEITRRTVLQMMQGCLAIGTDVGKIILLDLNLLMCEKAVLSSQNNEDEICLVPCHIVQSNLNFTRIREHYKLSLQRDVNFGIELNVVDEPSLVLSLLSITTSLCLAVGLEDGRMILYDLSELQAFHMAFPPEKLSPLVKLSYLLPPDDSRACMFIWAFHENSENPVAVMHAVMYDKQFFEDDTLMYEDFQKSRVCLTMPTFDRTSLPITCQSITKFPTQGDEEIISLCLLAWKSENSTQLLVFDLNQWYKEEMPNFGDWRKNMNFLAPFTLKHCQPLDVFIDVNTIAIFNSIQRIVEHFYPISMSFDCMLLLPKGSSCLHWPGLQNRALNLLSCGGSLAILEPNVYFSEIKNAALMPKFYDYNFKATFSTNVQREILLSVALEYNCFGLLKECANNWVDGSHLGTRPNQGLSISTLTDWIWKRAGQIKSRSNSLCVPLFDNSGLKIDHREQKEMAFLSQQLKLLADLMQIVLLKCKDYTPQDVYTNLKIQQNSIQMSSEYQEVLQWLLNIGLLPEIGQTRHSETGGDNESQSAFQPVPYPYKVLKNYYMSQRMKFFKVNKEMISTRTKSCRALYIDSFIEHECNPNVLREEWLESGGNGLYPPPSLQAMLRTLLVPDVPLEKKYVLFIYLFLDLNMAVEDERHAPIVQNLIKFPAVFKLNASLIKTVQAFWNLDHGQYEVALQEIISPFSQDKKLLQWQQELLIESLLTQDQANLALRALQARSSPVNSLLELKTLMANDLIAEAFHLARSKNDNDILKTFLQGCLYLGKWCVLRDLALTDEEGKIVEELFKESKSSKAGNLHFIYLLQKSKYVEALTYLDDLASSHRSHNQKIVDLETPQLILSAYNITMTPAYKNLADSYYKIRDRMQSTYNGKSDAEQTLNPLSCQLLKQNANKLIGDLYQSSAISIDMASNYWEEFSPVKPKKFVNHLLNSNNAPFVRKPQPDAYIEIMPTSKDSISYPEVYKYAQKRRFDEDENYSVDQEMRSKSPLENPQKRRRVNESNDSSKLFVIRNRKNKPINTSLLTKFETKKSINDVNVTILEKTTISNATSNQNVARDRSSTLLSTPIVKSNYIESKDYNSDTFDDVNDRVLTPQNILKVKELIRFETPQRRHRKYHSKLAQDLCRQQELNNAENCDDVQSIASSVNDKDISSEIQISIGKGDGAELPNNRKSTSMLSVNTEKCETHPEFDNSSRVSMPQKRRSIRSHNNSMVSITSVEEFFSPNTSTDVEICNNSNMMKSFESEINENVDDEVDEAMETSELAEETPQRTGNYKEISTDSGADVCMSADMSMASTSTNRLQLTGRSSDSPKKRRILSRSNSPKLEDSNARSKTPESPTRRSNRLLTRYEGEKTPEKQIMQTRTLHQQKSLSRIVLESNAMKIISHTKTDESEIDFIVENTVEVETTETNENLQKTDTENFQPTISSSKVTETLSAFENSKSKSENDGSEFTTIEGEISFSDTSKSTIPVDVTVMNTTKNQDKWLESNDSLMTTMDMSNVSANCTLFDEPEDVSVKSFEENIKVVQNEECEATKSNALNLNADVVEETSTKSESEENFETENNAQLYDDNSYDNDENLNDDEVNCVDNDSGDEDEDIDAESDSDIEPDYHSEVSENDLEDLSIIASSNSSHRSNSPMDNEIINISSSNESNEFEENSKSSSVELNDSPEQHNYSELLYGDIDDDVNENEVTEDVDIDNDFNNPGIFSKVAASVLIVDENSEIDLRGNFVSNVVTEGHHMNFLTGEEDKITNFPSAVKEITENVESEEVVVEENIVIENPLQMLSTEEIGGDSNVSVPNDNLAVKVLENAEQNDNNTDLLNETMNSESQLILKDTSSSDEKIIDTMDKEEEKEKNELNEENPLNIKNQSEEISTVVLEEDIELKVSDDDDQNLQAGVVNEKQIIIESETLEKGNNISDLSVTTPKSKLNLRKFRSISEDKEFNLTKRNLRSASVPKTIEEPLTPNRILRKRAGSTDCSSPHRIITRNQTYLLDRIDESSVFDSPSKRTRSRTRLSSIDSDNVEIPTTPMSSRTRRRSSNLNSSITDGESKTPVALRAKSILSEDNSLTPRKRVRRLSSLAKEASPKETENDQIKKYTKTTIEKPADLQESVIDNTKKSNESKKTVAEKRRESKDSTPISPDNKNKDLADEYSGTRRLTRTQKIVMEKSISVSKSTDQKTIPLKKRHATKNVNEADDEISPTKGESETESITSQRSKRSNASINTVSRRTTRSCAKEVEDDNTSISSSTKSNSSASKKKKLAKTKEIVENLLTIPEDQENESNASYESETSKVVEAPRKKGRPRKNKN